MAQVKQGDRVRINFTGTLEDGTIFDTTLENGDNDGECGCDDCGCEENGPMELTLGDDEFFLQVEEALIGMAAGEKKTVVIPAIDGFGEYDEEKVFAVERSQFPEDITPEIGMELEFADENDESYGVTVIEVSDEQITLDANHPLAGEDLTYAFELLEIL